jgi:hypothetical protein
MVDELEGFKDFSLALGMLLATINVAESTQNNQICPKTIRLRIFEMPPKIEILLFLKNKKNYV